MVGFPLNPLRCLVVFRWSSGWISISPTSYDLFHPLGVSLFSVSLISIPTDPLVF